MAILDRLRGQFQDSTNFRAFLTALAQVMDDLKTPIEDLRTKTDIDNAVGEQIDRNGEMLGINRNGLNDAQYKLLQSVKVKANISDGTPEVILEIAEEVAALTTKDLSPPDPIVSVIVEDFPAKFRINLTTTIKEEFTDLFRELINASRAAGIGFGVLHGGDDDGTNRFAYDTVAKGYGSGTKYTGVI